MDCIDKAEAFHIRSVFAVYMFINYYCDLSHKFSRFVVFEKYSIGLIVDIYISLSSFPFVYHSKFTTFINVF